MNVVIVCVYTESNKYMSKGGEINKKVVKRKTKQVSQKNYS